MSRISTWMAPLVFAAAATTAALAPAPAHAQSGDMIRLLVDASDVIFRSGTPYYRYGNYGNDDRLIVSRDRYGRPIYYRTGYANNGYRAGPPYGNAYGYHRNRAQQQRTRCDSRGRCTTTYYDPRQDRRQYDNRYYGSNGYDYGYDGRGRW